MPTTCYMLEPTGQQRRFLRRYSRTSGSGWTCETGWHEARVFLDEVPDEKKPIGDSWPHDDERWPSTCGKCDYAFSEDDQWQLFVESLYKRSDNDELTTIRDAPPGAMWYADWLSIDRWKGPDGRTLMCKTPGGEWMIDGQASNCTLPNDAEHRCWVRSGEPPKVTAGKTGRTCSAGAGSIACGSYHGFLRDGILT